MKGTKKARCCVRMCSLKRECRFSFGKLRERPLRHVQRKRAKSGSDAKRHLELVVIVREGSGGGVGKLLVQGLRFCGRNGELGRRQRRGLHEP